MLAGSHTKRIGDACECDTLPTSTTGFGYCTGDDACGTGLNCVVTGGVAACYGSWCCSGTEETSDKNARSGSFFMAVSAASDAA